MSSSSDMYLLESKHKISYCSEPLSVSTIGQIMADVPNGLALTPHQETKKKVIVLKSAVQVFLISCIQKE
jgi:hypothetical protein